MLCVSVFDDIKRGLHLKRGSVSSIYVQSTNSYEVVFRQCVFSLSFFGIFTLYMDLLSLALEFRGVAKGWQFMFVCLYACVCADVALSIKCIYSSGIARAQPHFQIHTHTHIQNWRRLTQISRESEFSTHMSLDYTF